MRMWMIKPEFLCNQHLLGEHFEIHKAVGNLKNSGKWANSLTRKGYLEPQNFIKRHDLLVKEMEKRKFNHKSSLDVKKIKLTKGNVCIKKSIRDLRARCKNCKV